MGDGFGSNITAVWLLSWGVINEEQMGNSELSLDEEGNDEARRSSQSQKQRIEALKLKGK